RQKAMNVRCAESPFPGGGERPFQLAVCRVHGVEIRVVAFEVDESAVHGWRRGDAPLAGEFPLLLSARGVDRVEVAVGTADEHHAVRYCRGGVHLTAGLE